MNYLKTNPNLPIRLVLIEPKGVALYEGRKRVAVAHGDFQYTAAEIEAMRVTDLATLTET